MTAPYRSCLWQPRVNVTGRTPLSHFTHDLTLSLPCLPYHRGVNLFPTFLSDHLIGPGWYQILLFSSTPNSSLIHDHSASILQAFHLHSTTSIVTTSRDYHHTSATTILAMDPPRLDEFPRYTDGDVSIVISPTRIYQLHSTVLKRNSPYFECELQEPGARLTSKARQEGLAAYRFELVSADAQDIGYFVRKVCTSQARP